MARNKGLVLSAVTAAAGKGIVIQITADPSTTKAALEQIREQMARTAQSGVADTEALTAAMSGLRTVMAGLGLGLGVTAAIAGVRSLIGDSLELGNAMEKASQKTGLTVETLSVLHYAAGVTGSDFDGLTAAVGKMDTTIAKAADGDKKAGAFMRSLGLDAKELTERSDGAEVGFQKFIQTLSATENPLRRNELAMGLLGKAGKEQIPMLLDVAKNWEYYKQRAQDAGVLLDGPTAAALADTTHRLNDLQQSLTGAGLALTEGMVPGLNQMTSVMSDGKGDRALMLEWGHDLVRVLAAIAMTAYSAAAGFEMVKAAADDDDVERAKADTWGKKAEQMRDVMLGKTPTEGGIRSFLPSPGTGKGGGGFGGAPVAGKVKSDDPIAEAEAKLAEAQAQLAATARRTNDQAELAETEAQHKLLLMSDEEYFKRKLDVQNDELDAEEQALKAKQKTLQDLYTKQHGDKLLKRDKGGNSAEELRTQTALVDLQGKLLEIQGKRQQAESAYNAEVGAAGMAAELNSLRLAAALEKERGEGIAAQIALIQKEHELEAQKVVREGGSDVDAAAVRSAGELQVKRLQLKDVDEDINRIQNDHRRALDDINDRATKGEINKRTAAQKTREENASEVQQLQQKVAEAEAYAKAIGDPALMERVKDMQQQVNDLGRTDHRGTFGKEITDGMQSMTERLAESAATGKESFGSMVNSMLQDAERLALKLAEQRFLEPLFEGAAGGATGGTRGGFWASIFGAGAEHHMSGGVGGDGPQVVGEAGPEVWTPPTHGGTYTPSNMLAKVAENGGGGGRAPNITQNIVNASSQPVNAQAPQVSYDEQSKSFVIHTLLTDYAEGGPLSQMHAG